ncbi:MAG: chloride channel protein [Propionibacteriaceae bacterium]|nr:chloride channel protein [Propionibacteriaceae bacterium]
MTTADTAPARAGDIGRLTLWGVAAGLLAGAGASAFVAVQHHLTHLIWHTLPEALGLPGITWWMALGLPVVGALLTWAAIQLPGHGGHGPLDGLGLDIGPREVVSVMLAALASLCFGAVLGPEAPLLAIGTASGMALVRGTSHPARAVLALVGAMAAAGAVLGNPLVTAVLLLELALAAGTQLARPAVLVPALAGLGSGYLLQVGLGPWTGLGHVQLQLTSLPAYPSVRIVDLLAGVVLAVVVAGIAVLAQRLAGRVAGFGRRAQLPTLLAAATVTGGAAAVVMLATGESPEMVLFAGQTSMSAYLTLSSFGVAAAVLLGKFVGYVACLGGGFKGGPMFPALALGAVVAAMASMALGVDAVPAMAATAIAAATAGAMKLPFTGVLLATMLTLAAGPAVTAPAILGAVVGLLTRLAIDSRAPSPAGASPAA